MSDIDDPDADLRPLMEPTPRDRPPLCGPAATRWWRRRGPVALVVVGACGSVAMAVLTSLGVAASISKHSSRVGTLAAFLAVMLLFSALYFVGTMACGACVVHTMAEERHRERALEEERASRQREVDEMQRAEAVAAGPSLV